MNLFPLTRRLFIHQIVDAVTPIEKATKIQTIKPSAVVALAGKKAWNRAPINDDAPKDKNNKIKSFLNKKWFDVCL